MSWFRFVSISKVSPGWSRAITSASNRMRERRWRSTRIGSPKFRVSAKALVTVLDLDRSLAAQHVSVDGDRLTGEIRNDGLDEVTVPHVFLTLRDDRGEVGWVDDEFISHAVRPQRSTPFTIAPPAPDQIEQIDVPIKLYANGQAVASVIELPPLLTNVAGWTSADLTLVGFTR